MRRAKPVRGGRDVAGGPGCVPPERLEAEVAPGPRSLCAHRGDPRPVVVRGVEEVLGDLEVAVELVLHRDPVARVEEVALLDVLRAERRELARQVEVLHEHAAAARLLRPAAGELAAHRERPRQVVAAEDHHPVPEPVHALVAQERRRERGRARAHRLDLRDQLVLVPGALERVLDQPVVVARAADHRALAHRLRRVAVVAGERGGADQVGDRVAVAAHSRHVPVEQLRDERQGDGRPRAVGEVPERLLVTGEARPLAARDRDAVRLEVPRRRMLDAGKVGRGRGIRRLTHDMCRRRCPATHTAEHQGEGRESCADHPAPGTRRRAHSPRRTISVKKARITLADPEIRPFAVRSSARGRFSWVTRTPTPLWGGERSSKGWYSCSCNARS